MGKMRVVLREKDPIRKTNRVYRAREKRKMVDDDSQDNREEVTHIDTEIHRDIRESLQAFQPFSSTLYFWSRPFPRNFRRICRPDGILTTRTTVPGIGPEDIKKCGDDGILTPQDLYRKFHTINHTCGFVFYLMSIGIKRFNALHCAYTLNSVDPNLVEKNESLPSSHPPSLEISEDEISEDEISEDEISEE